MRRHVASKRKARTHYEYELLLKVHIFPKLGSRRITDVRRVDVARLHAGLSDRPFVANRCLALVSSIWNWAARGEEVQFTGNPAKGIDRYPERGRERYLTSKEFERLGNALRTAETSASLGQWTRPRRSRNMHPSSISGAPWPTRLPWPGVLSAHTHWSTPTGNSACAVGERRFQTRYHSPWRFRKRGVSRSICRRWPWVFYSVCLGSTATRT